MSDYLALNRNKDSCMNLSFLIRFLDVFFFFFTEKIPSFKIAMSGRVSGIGRHPRFTFWLTFFILQWKNPSLMLFGIFLILPQNEVYFRKTRIVSYSNSSGSFIFTTDILKSPCRYFLLRKVLLG